MTTLTRILGAFCLMSIPALGAPQASQETAPGKKTSATRVEIEAWIAQLGSDRPEEREAAVTKLTKVGPAAIPVLKQALAEAKDEETRARLELILSELEIPDFPGFFDGRGKRPQDDPDHDQAAIDAALRWLARHQNADGSWSADRFDARCTGAKCSGSGEADYHVGVTALALLPFLGAGFTPDSPAEIPDPADPKRGLKPADLLRSGLRWLLSKQDAEGCIGERGMKYLYDHATATLALAEALAMTRAEFLKVPAQKAVDFLVAGRNPGKAWRYSAKCGDNDTSVTGWAVQALFAASIAGLKLPREALAGAIAWIDEASDPNGYFAVGYNAKCTGKVFVPGKNEQFEHHATMSAIAAVMRILIQKRVSAPILGQMLFLPADLPEWKTNAIDSYYWYYGSLALYQAEGPAGESWKLWHPAVLRALLPNQKGAQDGCQAGSWDASVDRWGAEGGRLYTTAINALTLETSRRYPVIPATKWPARR